MMKPTQREEIFFRSFYRKGIATSPLRPYFVNVIGLLVAPDDSASVPVDRGRLLKCGTVNPQFEYTVRITLQVVGHEWRSLVPEPSLLFLRSCLEPCLSTQGLSPATKRTTTLECLIALEISSITHVTRLRVTAVSFQLGSEFFCSRSRSPGHRRGDTRYNSARTPSKLHARRPMAQPSHRRKG